jgi:GTPase SAR1 family protein
MTEIVDLTLKVCFLGDSSVGKTSLIKRYVYDIFGDKYLMTMGTKVTKKKVTLDMPEFDKTFNLTFMIWDIIGDIHFRGLLHHSYLFGAAGALIVCDLTRHDTLDGKEEHKFSEKDIDKFAKTYNSQYLLTSAKTGNNVEEAFRALGKQMIEQHWNETEAT